MLVSFFKLIPYCLVIISVLLVYLSVLFKSSEIEHLLYLVTFVVFVVIYLVLIYKKRKLEKEKKEVKSFKIVFSAILSEKVFGFDAIWILFLFSATLFHWLPSFLEKGEILKAGLLFFACVNSFYYLLCCALEKYSFHKKYPEFPEKRRVLIRAISFNKRTQEEKEKYLNKLIETSCENLVNNKNLPQEIFNLGPLFKAIYFHAYEGPLEKAYLIVPKTLSSLDILNQKILHALKEKIEECIGREVVEFVEEKGLDFEDYHTLREKVLELLQKIQKSYSTADITVDISGGTSVVSAALILVAIKGQIQAQYISQSDPQTLRVINTDVLDLGDLLEELAEKFTIE